MGTVLQFKIDVTARLAEANKLLGEGHLHDAEEVFEQFLDHDEARMGISAIHFMSENFEQALSFLEGNNSLEAWLARITLAQKLGEDKLLVQSFEKAYEMSNKEIWQQYAEYLIENEKYEQAVEILLEEHSEHGAILLADCYSHLSKIDTSRDILKQIIKQNRNNLVALLELVNFSSCKEDTLPNCASELERFLSMAATRKVFLPSLEVGAGKQYEYTGDMKKACEHYNKFLKMMMDDIPKEVFKGRLLPADAKEAYTKAYISSIPHTTKKCPLVFVLGMPRSGSTLIEQILVAHSKVSTLGETVGISTCLKNLLVDETMKPESPDEALELYLKRLPEITTELVIDKMPGNFHYIGFIYSMFPDAKFIYTKRNALDNAVGCLTTQFRQAHPYSYDMFEMAYEYKNHEEFMGLWNSILPEGTILQVNYEDMVDDTKGQTTAMLDFLGLSYEESCAKFYEVKRDVRTASLAQVCKPIYTTSKGRGSRFLVDDEFKKLDNYLKMSYEALTALNEKRIEELQ